MAPMPPSAPPPPRPNYGHGITAGNAGGGPIAQGPIAQMGGGGGGTPFVPAGPMPGAGTDPEESRSRSYQVFALVFGMLVMVCLLVVLAVGLVIYNKDMLTEKTPPVARVEPPPPEPDDEEEVFVAPDPPPPPPSQPRNTTPRNTTPSTPPPPRDTTPKVGAGPVAVALDGPTGQVNRVEGICSGSTTGRVSISNGGTASVKVTGSDCKLSFSTQGGTKIKTSSSVSGGRSVKCTVNGNVVSCG